MSIGSDNSASEVKFGSGRIFVAAARVQAMSPLRRALLAREALIRAAGDHLVFGPAEGQLRRILSLTGRSGLVPISFALLIKRVIGGLLVASKGASVPDALFIGIGALREKHLIAEIVQETGQPVAFIDQRTPIGFSSLPTPPARRILWHWRKVMVEAKRILDEADPDFTQPDIFSSLVMRAHEISYLLAFFEILHALRPNLRIMCSTADMTAHAACIAGFKVEYHQHGLLRQELVFPEFSSMYSLTKYEGRHVAARVPDLVLKSAANPQPKAGKRKILAIAGDYQATNPDPVTALVKMAVEYDYRVVVRPHPLGHESPWLGIRGCNGVTFETEGNFDDFLVKWRPAFIVSWFSTTLLDGLMAGAVPVTLSERQVETVLPLNNIAVAFPQERARLETCMRDEATRAQLYDALKTVVMR